MSSLLRRVSRAPTNTHRAHRVHISLSTLALNMPEFTDPRLNFLSTDRDVDKPIRATFSHRVPGASGEVALHYWPARDSPQPPEHLFVFILGDGMQGCQEEGLVRGIRVPSRRASGLGVRSWETGNPALLEYYTTFLSHLHHNLPPSHAVLATSHIGHSPALPAPAEPLHLVAQLEAKIELISALQSTLAEWSRSTETYTDTDSKRNSPTPRISLIGHSVGAWLAIETAKRLPSISAVYMLFPTVGWIAKSANGRTLWPIFTQPLRHLIPYLSYLLRPILPFLALSTFPPPTLALLRSPRTIANALGLARTEMDTILAPDLEYFATQAKSDEGEGVYGIWSEGKLDKWVGEEGPQVQLTLGGEEGGRVRVMRGVPHAFCLSSTHSHDVAGVLINWINPSADVSTSSEGVENVHSGIPM